MTGNQLFQYEQQQYLENQRNNNMIEVNQQMIRQHTSPDIVLLHPKQKRTQKQQWQQQAQVVKYPQQQDIFYEPMVQAGY